jgi:hypothetical protein
MLICLSPFLLSLLYVRTFQILFYALRPTFVRSQRLTRWHLLNILTQLVFDFALVTTFGTRPLIYLIMSSFFAGSLHPCAGHFIAEHYLWDGMEQETYSYYGPLNVLAYNVSCIFNLLFVVANDNKCPRLDIIMNITTFLLYHGHVCLPSEPWHPNFTISYPHILPGQWLLSTLSAIKKSACSRGRRGLLKRVQSYMRIRSTTENLALLIAGFRRLRYLIKVNDIPRLLLFFGSSRTLYVLFSYLWTMLIW